MGSWLRYLGGLIMALGGFAAGYGYAYDTAYRYITGPFHKLLERGLPVDLFNSIDFALRQAERAHYGNTVLFPSSIIGLLLLVFGITILWLTGRRIAKE